MPSRAGPLVALDRDVFIGKTDEEISLVCKTDDVPQNTIFAVSTFNTDYILVKAENFEKALKVLSDAGYDVV
ncbi:ACT domain-containing protein [uncultured Fibrobacter sp.]|uniref:ACT domain-containing protein n=1 Tax=uncultured Fibrobacter sp. TaxID=261512 RepID=UPI00345866CE